MFASRNIVVKTSYGFLFVPRVASNLFIIYLLLSLSSFKILLLKCFPKDGFVFQGRVISFRLFFGLRLSLFALFSFFHSCCFLAQSSLPWCRHHASRFIFFLMVLLLTVRNFTAEPLLSCIRTGGHDSTAKICRHLTCLPKCQSSLSILFVLLLRLLHTFLGNCCCNADVRDAVKGCYGELQHSHSAIKLPLKS